MPNVYIQQKNQIVPAHLFSRCISSNGVKRQTTYLGKAYRLLAVGERDSSDKEYGLLIIDCLFKTIFSLGVWLISQELRDNWKTVFSGKRIIHYYVDSQLPRATARIIKNQLFPPNQDHWHALRQVICKLRQQGGIYSKKAALLQKSLNHFFIKKCPLTLKTSRLKNKESFLFNTTSSYPAYFNQKFNPHRPLHLDDSPSFYHFMPTGEGVEDFWVDFANANLGGGCFGHGFVQEEKLVAEVPEFAAHIANHWENGGCTIQTRNGRSPNPYLLKGLHQVQEIDKKIYGHKTLEKIAQPALLQRTLCLDTPKKINILAIAAPDLPNSELEQQWNLVTIADNLNTLIAGFTLVKEQSANPIIHSGKLGCGAFNNDAHLIYLLHCLAAQYTGVKVKLYGYEDKEARAYQDSWNQIAPNLINKSLAECTRLIHDHLWSVH